MIIFNADDFGFNTTENELIKDVVQYNIIKSVSLMANFGIEEIVNSLNSGISIGFHMNLVEGKSFTQPSSFSENGFFLGKKGFLERYLKGKINKAEVKKEIEYQLKFILDNSFKISHGDSHQSLHSIPFVFNIYENILKAYGINKIRNTVSCFNWFGDKKIIKAFFQKALSCFTTGKTSLIHPEFVLVGCPGFGNKNIENIDHAIEMWDNVLSKYYNHNTIIEVPCHLGLSRFEYELYKNENFLRVLNSHKVKIGNYYDI